MNGDANAAQYSLFTNRFKDDDKCKQQVYVSGRGVKDTFNTACAYNYNTLYTSEEVMLYDSPEANITLFTDELSTLFVIQGGKCSKKQYSTQKGKTTSTSSEMADKECTKLKERTKKEIADIRNSDQSDETEDNGDSSSEYSAKQSQSDESVSSNSDDDSSIDDESYDSDEGWKF